MEYVSVKNLEKYLPGYKDRSLSWIKLYFRNAIDTKNNTTHTSIFNDEKFQGLDEIDQIRFLKLACMQADTGKPVPMTDRNVAWMGWDTKKRPKSKTLLMLQSFLIVCNSPSKDPVPQNRIDKEEEKDKEEEYMSIFNAARKKYPSTKKGLSTEYANFVKKHTDWKNILPLLLPAIERQIIWRAEDGRYWKNFQTWINQRSWEETASNQHAGKDVVKPKKCVHCANIGVYVQTDDAGQKYWLCENHKPKYEPLKGVPIPQMKGVLPTSKVDLNDARNKNKDALGVE